MIDNTRHDALPGRHPQHRLRALVGQGPRARREARARPTGGQAWALKRIQGGDTTCKANQALHPEAVNLIAKIRANSYYVPAVADPLSPVTFVHKIKVPVFLACQWTDEQTGGHCPDLADALHRHQPQVVHVHQRHAHRLARPGDVQPLVRLPRALRRAAQTPSCRRRPEALAPTVFRPRMGVPDVNLPARPDPEQPTYDAALAAFEALPPVRILFDNGAGGRRPGQPFAGFEQSFAPLPAAGHAGALLVPRRRAARWRRPSPPRAGADAFTWNKAARPGDRLHRQHRRGPGGLWTATPPTTGRRTRPGRALSYLSAPLARTRPWSAPARCRRGSRSSAPDVDLQATVSEVRPDGKETFVQNGWLRASARKLDAATSTLLEPVPSLRSADAAPLPRGRFTEVDGARSTTRATPTGPARASA